MLVGDALVPCDDNTVANGGGCRWDCKLAEVDFLARIRQLLIPRNVVFFAGLDGCIYAFLFVIGMHLPFFVFFF